MRRLLSHARPVSIFGFVCGLLAASAELILLARGGGMLPGLRLRLLLFSVYGVAAASIYLGAGLLTRKPARRLALAAGGFGALVVLPLLNFDYLPQLFTWRTVVGNLASLLLLTGLARTAARFPRTAAAAAVAFALAVNTGGLARPRAPGGGERAAAAPARPVNVVIVLVDTLRADHLGTYGYPRPTSPHIDRLARSSVVFEEAISQATYTKPAVASLLTGSFVHRHGVISSRDALGPELTTLAEQLRAHGYQAAAFSANPWITPEFRFERGFDHFESNRAIDVQLTVLYRFLRRVGGMVGQRGGGEMTKWLLRASGEPNPSNSRRDELLTESLLGWLENNHDRPFFIYAHLIGPHDPYDPPEEAVRPFRDPSWDGVPAPTRPPERVLSVFETARSLDPPLRQMLIAQYDGAIAFVDGLVGRIVAKLEGLGLLDRTLLIITSDHGEEFYEHGNWGHGVRLYQEMVRVPLLFRLPGVLAPGRRADPAMLVDVFPTVCALVGISCGMPQLNGRDLFTDSGQAPPVAFSEYFSVEGGSYVSRMVLQNGMKLIETHDAARGQRRSELFDLRTDPTEQRNVFSAGEEQSEMVARLRGLLDGFAEAAPRHAPAAKLDEKTREALRALGYGGLDQP